MHVNTAVISCKPLLIGVSLSLWLCFTEVMASPEGGVVVAGDGSIVIDGDKTTITQQSSNLVVDWDSFNVGQQEHVHFQQQQTSDSVLNRIYDSRPSEIWGKITARGNVWLLNPNGVFFSRTSRVSTGGLVAAGLWVEQQDFMSGRYVLNNSRGVGDVSNAGTLEATSSGIGLAGGNVNNSGTIRASTSTVSLASGEQVAVDFAGDGLLRFAVESSLADASINHSGSIEAAEVELSTAVAGEVFSGVINTSGVITARSVDGSGGNVVLQAGDIEHSGEIIADGTTGGEVLLEADKDLLVSGSISARGKKGDGGLSTEQTGGSIRLLAERVTLESIATVDVSGDAGGGEVLAGGGWQGKDPTIRNAEETTVKKGAIIKANANIEGDGGTVVVWSDGTIRYAGHIEARGGAQGGDGGEAEVSGKESLQVQGFADLTAPNGKSGHFLLDPGDVTICDAADAMGCANDPAATPLNTFTDDYIQTQLGMGDVTISTSAATNGMNEDINVDDGVSIMWSANTLTLDAGSSINLGGTLAASGTGALALEFGGSIRIGSADLSGISSTITTTGDGTSSLIGPRTDTIWTIDGDSVTVGGVTMALSMVTFISGGQGADTFMVTGDSTYSIYGESGDDVFIIGASLTGSLGGGRGADTFNFNMGSSVSGGVAGSAGADTFNFNMGSSVSGGVTGSAGADTFDFNGGTVMGTVAGGATNDVLDFAGINTALMITLSGTSNVDGFSGTVTDGAMVSFSGINDIVGGSGTDSLQGLNVAATWILGSDDSYVDDSQTFSFSFSALENMFGGTAVDTFTINGAHTGDISGGAGTDVLDFRGITAALTITLGGTPDADGFSGTVTDGAMVSFSGVNDIVGGSGTDSLQGLNAAAIWTLSVADSYAAAGQTLSFSALENMVGGTAVDTFIVNGVHTGDLSGGAGADVLGFGSATRTRALMITLSSPPDENGFGGMVTGGARVTFNGVNTITGGSVTDSLRGLNDSAIWTLGAADSYIAGGQSLSFSDLENMVGGTAVDTFTVNGAHSGDISGGGGADIFTITAALTGYLSGGDGSDTFNLDGGTVTGAVAGDAGTDTLQSAGTSWTVVAYMVGTGGATYTLSSVENLVATGNAATTFTVSGNIGYSIDGGMGTDTLQASAYTWTVAGNMVGTAGATYTLSSVENLVAPGNGVNIFTVSGSTSYSIDGGMSSDIVRGPDTATIWGVNGNIVSIGGTDFTLDSIETLQGGSMMDTFMVTTGTSTYNIEGRGGNDVLTIMAVPTGSLSGGDGDDIFNLNMGSIVMGGIAGGAGADTFNFNMGSSVMGGVTSGAGVDTFNFNGGAVMGAVEGGADTDTLQSAGTAWTVENNVVSIGMTTYTVFGVENLVATGNAATTFTLRSGPAYIIDGGMGSDIVRGHSISALWSVDGGTVSIGGTNYTLSSIETLQGGSMTDFFMVTGASTYNIEGRGGGDFFTITAALTGSLSGGDGSDTFNLNMGGSVSGGVTGGAGGDGFVLNGGTVIGVVAGGAGVDRVRGPDAATIWGVDGGTVSIGGTDFTLDSIEILQGGSMIDTFMVTGTSTYNDIGGGGGNDVFTVTAALTGSLFGGNGSDTFNLDGGTVTGMVAGGADTDTLQSAGTAWTVASTMVGTGMATYTVNSVENLVATGNAATTFTVRGSTAYSIDGGMGNDIVVRGPDVFTIWGIDGGTVSVGGTDFTLDSIETIQGGSMIDTFMVTGISTYNIEGRGGNDVFIIGAALSGSLSGGDGDDTFNLNMGGSVSMGVMGGAGSDTFDFNGGTVMDTVAGGAGADVLNFGGITTALMIGLSGTPDDDGFSGTITGGPTAMFGGINTITSGDNTGDILQGLDMDATWTLGGATDSYEANSQSLSFSSLENMVGGTAVDTFILSGGRAASIDGGVDTDIVRGPDAATIWGVDGGTVSIGGTDFTLSSIETLQGGSLADTFTVTGDSTYNIEGRGGADTFTLNAVLTGSLDGGDGDDNFNLNTGSSVSMGVIGGAGGDTFNFNAGGSVSGGVTGGAGADTFDFDGGTITGTIAAGADGDILDFADVTAALTIALSGTPDGDGFSGVVTGGVAVTFNGINTIAGGTGTDSLQGLDMVAAWTLGAADSYAASGQSLSFSALENIVGGTAVDTFTVNGSHTGDISGGADGDNFNFNSGGTVTGTVAGGLGHDLLDFSALPAAVEVAMGGRPDIGGGTVTSALGFSGYVSGGAVLGDADAGIIGFSGINEITGTAAATGDTLAGLAEAGTFTIGPEPDSGSPVDYYGVDAVTVRGSPYLLVLNGIEDYVSGGESDSYVIQRAYSGDLVGGNGANSFTIDAPFVGNIMSGAGKDTIIIANVITGNVDSGGSGDFVQLMPGGRVIGSLAMGETGETVGTDVDVLDVKSFDVYLTIIYDADGGQAYVADGYYGSEDGVPDAVIMSDGQTDGMPGSGILNGIYGAELIEGVPHDPDSGTGTYFVVQPVRRRSPAPDLYAADLTINGGTGGSNTGLSIGSSTSRVLSPDFPMVSLTLPDLRSFPGYVLIGGSGAPPVPLDSADSNNLPLAIPGVTPDPVSPQKMAEAAVIQTRRLIVEGDIAVLGSVILLGSGVELQADVYTGVGTSSANPAMVSDRSGTEIAIVATGASTDDFAGNGMVAAVLTDMESERIIASGGGLIIASNTFMNAGDTVIDLGGSGRLQFAQGRSEPVSFRGDSSFTGIEVQEDVSAYIMSGLGQTGLVSLILTTGNPASSLVQTGTVSADVDLSEEDLTLYSLIGKGISLYLSLCDEFEGCAPPVDLAEIESLLERARARLAELRLQLQGSSEDLRADLTPIVRRFEKVVQYMIKLRREYLEIFGEGIFIRDNNEIYEVSLPYYKHIAQADRKASDDL